MNANQPQSDSPPLLRQVLRLGWQPAAWQPRGLSDAAFAHMPCAAEVDITGCHAARFTDAGLRAALARVGVVHCKGCRQLSPATRLALAAPPPRLGEPE